MKRKKSKLAELINGLNESFVPKNNQKVLHDDFTLYPKHLSLIKEQLLSCDEFKECDLKILSLPNIANSDGFVKISSESLAVTPGITFKGKIYIYSMWLTPEMYDPSLFLKKMEGDGGIIPIIYNPENFVPERFIFLKVNPEEMQDSASKQPPINPEHRLHSVLNKILNNPDDYRIKGDRHVIVHGIFQTIKFPGGKGKTNEIDEELLENYVIK